MPLTRLQRSNAASSANKAEHVVDSDDEEEPDDETYSFEGKEYDSYLQMVEAKRKRNEEVLEKSGLLQGISASLVDNTKKASKRGISKKRKAERKEPLPRRKSNRLAGVQADGRYVEDEASGRFTIAGAKPTEEERARVPEPEHFKNRINDGSDVSVQQAILLADPKWIRDKATENAMEFLSSLSTVDVKRASRSPTSVIPCSGSLINMIHALAVDDVQNVAKVSPDRIYSVASHPATDKLVVCAGDKKGYVGIWNVDDTSEGDGVHLFHVHNRPVSCLSWTPTGDSLLSASYDGSVRRFDVGSQTFKQIFATFDDSVIYRDQLGRGLDQGYNYWTQYVCPDHRSASDECFFMSTSTGEAMHVDLRVGKGKLTFHEDLSEKKINTLSLHTNGYTLASAGLDCTVKLWDTRKFQKARKGKGPVPVTTQYAGKSVNSAFFSPSGSTLLSTTMANKLDITEDAHITNKKTLKATKRVYHDNHTGRWLCTFMATWHPSVDIFVVGSMRKPRAIEIFDDKGTELHAVQGDALTAVASRCCFHPSEDNIIVVGGNSSGRVTVVR